MLHRDIYRNLLLQADIHTVARLCSSNQELYKICAEPAFWEDKFVLANFGPYVTIQRNIGDWVNEYLITEKSINLTEKVVIQLIEGINLSRSRIPAYLYIDMLTINNITQLFCPPEDEVDQAAQDYLRSISLKIRATNQYQDILLFFAIANQQDADYPNDRILMWVVLDENHDDGFLVTYGFVKCLLFYAFYSGLKIYIELVDVLPPENPGNKILTFTIRD